MTKPHPDSDAPLGEASDTSGDPRGSPERQCAVTRERLPQGELVRFVLSPDGEVTPDVAGRLPGRGVWVTANRQTVDTASRKGAFSRGFKEGARVPEGMADTVEAMLARQCISLLGMARKAGDVVSGHDQVRDALRKARPALLLEASDGAEDGRQKVYLLAKALYGEVSVAGALSAAELGMAFGRDRVIHGLVRRGAIAKSWVAAYRRLTGFRDAPELNWFTDPDQ